MGICPFSEDRSLLVFLLVCSLAMLSVPAIPQPACKRAELLSQASDVFRQRVQEAVEKRRTAERELAEIEKQIKQVEERRCKREHELLRDYDQEIQKWEEATKELTEMINLLSVTGWSSFMRRFGHHFVRSPEANKNWVERQRIARTKLALVAKEKLTSLKGNIEATNQKITNIRNQLSAFEFSKNSPTTR